MTSDRVGARARRSTATPLTAALAGAALLLCACATAEVVDAPTALNGRDLNTALGLYGQYQDRVEVSGRTYYIWRKTVQVDGQHLSCELRAEVAYRSTIRSTYLEGYEGACNGFSVRYTSATDIRRSDEDIEAPGPLREASDCPGCRPVGSPTTTAQAGRKD